MASPQKAVQHYRSPLRASRQSSDPEPISLPQISISLDRDVDAFVPGDFLICEYRVKCEPNHDLNAIETSVIWLTEGKGEEDIGVHFFERRQKRSLTPDTFKQLQRLSTVLPSSPLSYLGDILKIRWCVRVRIYLANGLQTTEDKHFQLGSVRRFEPLAGPTDDDSDLGD